jgi:putative transcriptional regulator
MPVESLRGHLLLASPALQDPNFERTVVLVGQHDGDGAMGLVLNRPSTLTVEDVVPQLGDAIDATEPVFVGGPVQPGAIVLLAEFEDTSVAGPLVDGRIRFPGPDTELADLPEATRRGRVYAGYAGWGPGQLEQEIAGGDWIVEPAGPEDVFAESTDNLWATVLRRKGGRFALLASMPEDPSLN